MLGRLASGEVALHVLVELALSLDQPFRSRALCRLAQPVKPLLLEPRDIREEKKLRISHFHANRVLFAPPSLAVFKHVPWDYRDPGLLPVQVEGIFEDSVALGVEDAYVELEVIEEFESTLETVSAMVGGKVVVEGGREFEPVLVRWSLRECV